MLLSMVCLHKQTPGPESRCLSHTLRLLSNPCTTEEDCLSIISKAFKVARWQVCPSHSLQNHHMKSYMKRKTHAHIRPPTYDTVTQGTTNTRNVTVLPTSNIEMQSWNSRKQVLSISLIVHILESAELQKVCGPMDLAVILLGVCQLQTILHVCTVLDTLEVVVPTADIRNHVEAHEPVGSAALSVNVAVNS